MLIEKTEKMRTESAVGMLQNQVVALAGMLFATQAQARELARLVACASGDLFGTCQTKSACDGREGVGVVKDKVAGGSINGLHEELDALQARTSRLSVELRDVTEALSGILLNLGVDLENHDAEGQAVAPCDGLSAATHDTPRPAPKRPAAHRR